MDFREIEKILTEAFLKKRKLEIYYPRTETSIEGWRRVEPKSITTDIPPNGEVLVIGKDRLSPGHILNAYDEQKKEENGMRSFIIGKIRRARCA